MKLKTARTTKAILWKKPDEPFGQPDKILPCWIDVNIRQTFSSELERGHCEPVGPQMVIRSILRHTCQQLPSAGGQQEGTEEGALKAKESKTKGLSKCTSAPVHCEENIAGCPLVVLVTSFAQISVTVCDITVKYNHFPVLGNIQTSFHSEAVYKLGQFQIFISIVLKAALRNVGF